MEWEAQRVNCEALFAHINGESNYFVEARFGTLEEYFDAVHQEQRERSKAEISSRMLIELITIGAARHQHSLFQHHDGVTGTAKHYVVEDYAKRMLKAVNDCRFVMQQSLVEYPKKVTFSDHREISLRSRSSGITVAFTSEGMIKSIQLEESELRTPARVQFFRCGNRFKGELSAAYLFLPNGPATPIHNNSSPVVLVTEGPLESTVCILSYTT
ncbi:hypothetical protein GQX74_009622 [Glossina fuscipes]|nr:hypothetical protein GQX74_009622 [Glossina fuscipes]